MSITSAELIIFHEFIKCFLSQLEKLLAKLSTHSFVFLCRRRSGCLGYEGFSICMFILLCFILEIVDRKTAIFTKFF
jgi:hypothetical protein